MARLHGGIEIDENFARLRAFAGTQNTALLENINDARRAGVTEAQPPLQAARSKLAFPGE